MMLDLYTEKTPMDGCWLRQKGSKMTTEKQPPALDVEALRGWMAPVVNALEIRAGLTEGNDTRELRRAEAAEGRRLLAQLEAGASVNGAQVQPQGKRIDAARSALGEKGQP